MHCFLAHKSSFSMSFYKLGIVKKVKPLDLDREEARMIDKFMTKIWVLNRIVVVRRCHIISFILFSMCFHCILILSSVFYVHEFPHLNVDSLIDEFSDIGLLYFMTYLYSGLMM